MKRTLSIIILLTILLFLNSCTLSGSLIKRPFGKTKKIKANLSLTENDTLMVIAPFEQYRHIDNIETGLKVKSVRFRHQIAGIDYSKYDYFYDKPPTRFYWSKSDNKYIEVNEYSYYEYYQKYFEYPMQKLLNKRVPYTILKIDDEQRKKQIEQELGKMEKILQDSAIIELNISDEMCKQLQSYKKRYFLFTHILNYEIDHHLGFSWNLGFIWYRMLLLDIQSRKVILYRNKSDFFTESRGGPTYDFYAELKYFIKKLKPVLPKRDNVNK